MTLFQEAVELIEINSGCLDGIETIEGPVVMTCPARLFEAVMAAADRFGVDVYVEVVD